MTTIQIALLSHDMMREPLVDVLTLETGDRFIVIHLGDGTTVLPPGNEHDGCAYARALATALMQAVNQIEQSVVEPDSEVAVPV